MDSFELNKIMGAILGTCLVLLTLNITANALFSVHPPAKPGYAIAVPEEAPAGGPAAPAVAEEPIAVRLAKADLGRGEASFKKCAACHTVEKGGRNLVGPNLWGVLGRDKGSIAGVNYSAAMKAKGGKWTFEDMDSFLHNPRGAVPGTNMSFAGVPRATERADLIAFLNSKSDSPLPPPKAAEAAPAATPAAAAAAPAAAPAAPAAAAPAAPAAPRQAEAPAAPAPAAPPPAAAPAAPPAAAPAAPPAAAAPAAPASPPAEQRPQQ